MTKRQANLIIALIAVLIALQCLFGYASIRRQEFLRDEIAWVRTETAETRQAAISARKEAEAAQVSAMDTLEMQKRAREK